MTVWTVPGAVSRVIDADSLHVNLDLGWGVWRRDAPVRLAGINAPEMTTPEGKAAREWLLSYIGTLPQPCTVISHSIDKYGRVLAFVVMHETSADLSDALLVAGHAVPYT